MSADYFTRVLVTFLACSVGGCAHVAEQYQLAEIKVRQAEAHPPRLTTWTEDDISPSMYGPLNPDFILLDCNEVLDVRGDTCPISAVLMPTVRKALENVVSGSAGPTIESQGIVDDKLLEMQLQQHFPAARGYTGPAVRVIRSNSNEIVFWFYPGHATLEQAQSAANDWCGKKGRRASFVGGSLGCTQIAANEREYKLVHANNPSAMSNQDSPLVSRSGNTISLQVSVSTLADAARAGQEVRDTRAVAAYSCVE